MMYHATLQASPIVEPTLISVLFLLPSQVGRVVGGPADFYSGRIPRRRQKQTMVEELLASEEFRRYVLTH